MLIPDLSLDRKWSPEFAELRRTVENEDIAAMPAWFMTSFLIAFFAWKVQVISGLTRKATLPRFTA